MLFNTGTNLKDTTKMMVANSKRQISPNPETDGSTVEFAKRPRGRPPGSKNKPKPAVLITRQTEPASAAFRPHVLEIPAGHDVLEALRGFSRRKGLGVCVLSCAGAVANVTLRQPPHPTAAGTAQPAGTVGLRGRLEVLSLSATVMPPEAATEVAGVAVTVGGPQGQVVGGAVVGPLVAAGTVTVVAAAFEKATFHRLPVAEDECDVSVSGEREEKSGGRRVLVAAQQQEPLEQQQHHVHREYPHHHPTAAVVTESCGSMGIYSSSFATTDVIWAPMARPPPHRPPY